MTALFDGLFDDAALFPPGDAPMASAVPAHMELRSSLGTLVGPFVVPAARIDELLGCLGDADAFEVSLIAAAGDLPSAAAQIAADPRLVLSAVEVPVVDDGAAAAQVVQLLDALLPAGVSAAVEVPRTGARDAVLDVLAGTKVRAKLRTGGLRADLFPSPTELAGTLHACVARGLAAKCTAGLHHAVRRTDPAIGFDHHGFLNVLLAVGELTAGASPAAAAKWLSETDTGTVATAVLTWPGDRAERARAFFTSFGTCSIREPVDDLVALGLLASPDLIPT